jgi:hypothetical protein
MKFNDLNTHEKTVLGCIIALITLCLFGTLYLLFT